jgi:hypothetical protein
VVVLILIFIPSLAYTKKLLIPYTVCGDEVIRHSDDEIECVNVKNMKQCRLEKYQRKIHNENTQKYKANAKKTHKKICKNTTLNLLNTPRCKSYTKSKNSLRKQINSNTAAKVNNRYDLLTDF